MNAKTLNLRGYNYVIITVNGKSCGAYYLTERHNDEITIKRALIQKNVELKNPSSKETMKLITKAYSKWYNSTVDISSGFMYNGEAPIYMTVRGLREINSSYIKGEILKAHMLKFS